MATSPFTIHHSPFTIHHYSLFLHTALLSPWDSSALDTAAALSRAPTFAWSSVVALAEAEAVAPLLCATLRDRSWVDATALAALRATYERTALRNTLLLHAAGSLCREFVRAGIDLRVLS